MAGRIGGDHYLGGETMKNSFDLTSKVPPACAPLLAADQREKDNPDPYRPACRNYLDRIGKVVDLVRRWVPPGGKVAEIGCAQGNMSLLLAEAGYQVQAVDINPDFLEYSKAKYEKGNITWVHANLEDLPAGPVFDGIILGEIIEHCAWPEKVIASALGRLRPGGTLVVTTPNAQKVGEHLPTFSNFRSEEKRRELEKAQFGPAGEDHLFLFTMGEMKGLVPQGARLVDSGYLGGSLAFNSKTHHLFRLLPVKAYVGLIRLTAALPLFNRFSFHNLYMVLQNKE